MADRFRKLDAEERRIHDDLNTHLEDYSRKRSPKTFEAAHVGLLKSRERLNQIHNHMAHLTSEYGKSKSAAARRTFMKQYLGTGYSHQLERRFKDFSDRTEIDKDDKDTLPIHRNRFLAHSLQNLRYPAGRGRFNALMDNIDYGPAPRRRIKIGTSYQAPRAGLHNPKDKEKAHKANKRVKEEDQKLIESEGSLPAFVAAKRRTGLKRKANAKRGEIGHLHLEMDQGEMVKKSTGPTFESPLLPMYYGHDRLGRVVPFTSPLHTAIHHEVGHLTNALKGIEGPVSDKYQGKLKALTNEEELFNVHLDEHSDAVLSQEMRLPTRIAHGAFYGLNMMTSKLSESLVRKDLDDWDQKTHRVGTTALLKSIQQSVNSDQWGAHTRGRGKEHPKTVGTLKALLSSIPETEKDKRHLLQKIRATASEAAKGRSLFRKPATASFYGSLASLNTSSPSHIQASTRAIDAHRARHLTKPKKK